MGIVYQADFKLPDGDSVSAIRIPFSAFSPTSFGRLVPEMPSLKGSDIMQFGLMVSKLTDQGEPTPNFEFGPFQLDLKKINLFCQDSPNE